MSRLILHKVLTALMVAILLTTSFARLATAADQSAAVAQQLRDKQVKGTIAGGKFAKIWLGLETESPGAQITIASEWDRDNPLQNGVGFFILDDTGLTRAQAGDALNTIALGAGNIVDGASHSLLASLNAVGLAKYTIVVYNDSNTDANFTLTATNAFIVDGSNQVQSLNATVAGTPVSGSTTVTTTTTTTTNTAVTAAATPAAGVAATATTAAPATTATTVAPVVTGTPGVVKAKTLSGDLPEQNAQHFLGLQPSERDATITLRLSFDPQDSTELARRLNFWVLDQAGFTQFQGGSNASDVAIAAGSRDVDSQVNERIAHFKAVGFGPYTVIVYNNSRVPGSYSLTVDGGLLVDDSGQTRNAKQAATAVGATGTTTTATTTTTTSVVSNPAATPTVQAGGAQTTTTATRTGTPGGSYTVKSGDTLALIARDIYGDYKLYQQLCDFNNIANCNTIEIGQIVKLPTQAQIKAGVTKSTTTGAATTGSTTTAAPTPTKTATPATTSATTTSTTKPVTTTTTTTTPAVNSTGSITRTTSATTTNTTTGTTATGAGTIIDTLIANGGFKTLVAALQATGLDTTLKGPGPFTLFAPADAAFARLPAGALQQLMASPSGQLTDIVRYHVIKSKLMAADLSNGLQATTVQGKPVKFEVNGNTIKINGAQIITKDIQASNGVIQVIENVIIPPAE